MRSYDYIVIGGGSSGCIVAAQLSERGSVLLLEHGPDAESHPETLLADGYTKAFINDNLLFDRFSEVDERWGKRRMFLGTGHGLGGSGSVNAMVYTRGAIADYDEWPSGWRYRDLEPAFEALEKELRPRPRPSTQWSEACIAAAVQSGFRRSDNLNDGDLSGVLGHEHMNYEGDARRSSYVAFLRPARSRSSLTVETGADVRRITFRGRRGSGVQYHAAGRDYEVAARHEIVLCAGALETPKVLMRSGVGPADELRKHGIAEVLDKPAVGANLHDHPNLQLFFGGSGKSIDCKYPQLYGFHRANQASDLPPGQSDTCFVFYPARSSFREGLMRMVPGMVLPPGLYELPILRRAIRGAIAGAFAQGPVQHFIDRLWGIVVILGKPKSRGRVYLDSYDPAYFDNPEDMQTLLAGVDIARRMAAQPAMGRYAQTELIPGPMGRTEQALESWVRKNAMTTYHFAGTCRMGEDQASVVDSELRLRGLQGIRVADASVVPFTPVSAMNAPSMMIGYKASELILQAHPTQSAQVTA